MALQIQAVASMTAGGRVVRQVKACSPHLYACTFAVLGRSDHRWHLLRRQKNDV